ncbi:MAG: hypothetical protein RJA39_838, partial [Pseudomonadota bacterium]
MKVCVFCRFVQAIAAVLFKACKLRDDFCHVTRTLTQDIARNARKAKELNIVVLPGWNDG